MSPVSCGTFAHFEGMNCKLGNKYVNDALGWQGSEDGGDSGDEEDPDVELAHPSLDDDEGGVLGERGPAPDDAAEPVPEVKRRRVRGKQPVPTPPLPTPSANTEGPATPEAGPTTPLPEPPLLSSGGDDGDEGMQVDAAELEPDASSGVYSEVEESESKDAHQRSPATKHKVTDAERLWIAQEVKACIKKLKTKPPNSIGTEMLEKGKAGKHLDDAMSLWQIKKVIDEKATDRMRELWARYREKEAAKGNDPMRPTKFLRRSTVAMTTDAPAEESLLHCVHIGLSFKLLWKCMLHPSAILVASLCIAA